jgi:hypothetical protein
MTKNKTGGSLALQSHSSPRLWVRRYDIEYRAFSRALIPLTTTLNITRIWWRSVLVHSYMLYRPHQVELREPANTIPFKGPLANVLSIAALVTPWRMCLLDGVSPENCPWDGKSELLPDLDGHTFSDPHWCYALNILSLALGFLGNIFLLFNFTNRIRYIIALPFTIVLWYAATAIVGPRKHGF